LRIGNGFTKKIKKEKIDEMSWPPFCIKEHVRGIQHMLLSDLHCMDSYLSAILQSHPEDTEMTLSDNEASETSENADTMKDIVNSMRPICEKFNLTDTGPLFGLNARRYTLHIRPKNEWYEIHVGWNEPVGHEFITFTYAIRSENGYEGDDSSFELSDVIDALTDELEQITQGTLQPVKEEDGDRADSPGEEEEDMMDDIENRTKALHITHRGRFPPS
jgi:hypothetical protein